MFSNDVYSQFMSPKETTEQSDIQQFRIKFAIFNFSKCCRLLCLFMLSVSRTRLWNDLKESRSSLQPIVNFITRRLSMFLAICSLLHFRFSSPAIFLLEQRMKETKFAKKKIKKCLYRVITRHSHNTRADVLLIC